MIEPPLTITSRPRRHRDAATPERDADGALAFEQKAVGFGLCDHAQVGTLHRRAKVGDSGGATARVAGRQLIIADPLLARAVEIVVARDARLDHAVDERFAERVALFSATSRFGSTCAMPPWVTYQVAKIRK